MVIGCSGVVAKRSPKKSWPPRLLQMHSRFGATCATSCIPPRPGAAMESNCHMLLGSVVNVNGVRLVMIDVLKPLSM